MEDRFKLRIWDREKQCYHYMNEIEINDNGLWFPITDSDDIELHNDDKKPEIEQCTGLKDKHGKLIYEGDILEIVVPFCKHKYKAKIVFENGCFMIKSLNRDKKDDYNIHRIVNYLPEAIPEIIGNIHDNPELLKS